MIGIGMALVGSVAIGSGDFSLSGQAAAGDLLSLLGTIAVAIHMLAGKQLLKHISAFVYNFLVFAVAATSLTVYNAICGLPFTGYAPREWGIFCCSPSSPLCLGIICSTG
ncbi:hypothetical protein HMSSN036_16500 [Paenibacillus macerans]|nr:hypothetical protein HMSSN036_16500 [Paenibacillus macerans]